MIAMLAAPRATRTIPDQSVVDGQCQVRHDAGDQRCGHDAEHLLEVVGEEGWPSPVEQPMDRPQQHAVRRGGDEVAEALGGPREVGLPLA